MNFFSDAWYGIRKELSIYLSTPKLLLQKAASVIMFVLITIITGTLSSWLNPNLNQFSIRSCEHR